MSYILDALRRAEAERERGSVPSLHSQQFPMSTADDEAPRRPVGWMVAAGVLALALLGLGSWLWWAPAPQPVVVVAAPPPTVAPATAAVPAPVPPSAPTAASAAPAAPPVATSPSAAPPPRSVRTTPRERTSERQGERTGERTSDRAPDRTPDTAPRARERTPSPGAESDRVYTPSDLPEPARRALPALAFGGSSWSSDAGSRMVIWNGRVFHEGDTVAPGVVLRRIERRSALLVVQGHKVEIRF